jgi:hypothetical protein
MSRDGLSVSALTSRPSAMGTNGYSAAESAGCIDKPCPGGWRRGRRAAVRLAERMLASAARGVRGVVADLAEIEDVAFVHAYAQVSMFTACRQSRPRDPSVPGRLESWLSGVDAEWSELAVVDP